MTASQRDSAKRVKRIIQLEKDEEDEEGEKKEEKEEKEEDDEDQQPETPGTRKGTGEEQPLPRWMDGWMEKSTVGSVFKDECLHTQPQTSQAPSKCYIAFEVLQDDGLLRCMKKKHIDGTPRLESPFDGNTFILVPIAVFPSPSPHEEDHPNHLPRQCWSGGWMDGGRCGGECHCNHN
ncbi:hypothetical protein TCAL_15215 [Tigriopus californicus]|uniref:Uncharacterized protein n=1 Tax=Tigriopus californicus TaxID=6832 RepID=A0A553NBM6_TIGCA|nr:hypothetical protein TCAL_15215 [Tigriopus californicus]